MLPSKSTSPTRTVRPPTRAGSSSTLRCTWWPSRDCQRGGEPLLLRVGQRHGGAHLGDQPLAAGSGQPPVLLEPTVDGAPARAQDHLADEDQGGRPGPCRPAAPSSSSVLRSAGNDGSVSARRSVGSRSRMRPNRNSSSSTSSRASTCSAVANRACAASSSVASTRSRRRAPGRPDERPRRSRPPGRTAARRAGRRRVAPGGRRRPRGR